MNRINIDTTVQEKSRYSHAKQYNRSKREIRKLKTWLGCVYRDIYRKVSYPEEKLSRSLDIAMRILTQKKDSKNKIYSTLNDTIKQVERLTRWKMKDVYVDLGYRGHDYEGDAQVNIVNYRHMKRLTRSAKAWMKRRAAIEPIFILHTEK